MIALATVVHILRSRRFYARVITVAVAVRALGQIGKENQASTMARLTAWDKRQVQRLERKAKAQGRAVKGTGQNDPFRCAAASGGQEQPDLTIGSAAG